MRAEHETMGASGGSVMSRLRASRSWLGMTSADTTCGWREELT